MTKHSKEIQQLLNITNEPNLIEAAEQGEFEMVSMMIEDGKKYETDAVYKVLEKAVEAENLVTVKAILSSDKYKSEHHLFNFIKLFEKVNKANSELYKEIQKNYSLLVEKQLNEIASSTQPETDDSIANFASLLQNALKYMNKDSKKDLIARGDCIGLNPRGLLVTAAQHDNFKIVKHLLKREEKYHSSCIKSVLINAVKFNKLKIFKETLNDKKYKEDHYQFSFQEILKNAVKSNKVKFVKFMLRLKSEHVEYRHIPMIESAVKDKQESIIELYAKKSTPKNEYKQYIFNYTIKYGHIDLFEKYLECEQVNIITQNLRDAAATDNMDILHKIVNHPKFTKNKDTFITYKGCYNSGTTSEYDYSLCSAIKAACNLNTVEYLFEKIENKIALSGAIAIAAEKNQKEIFDFLLEKTPEHIDKTWYKKTALINAITHGYTGMVKKLLTANADITKKYVFNDHYEKPYTALESTVIFNQVECLDAFLELKPEECGSEVLKNLLNLAASNNKTEAVEYLLKKTPCDINILAHAARNKNGEMLTMGFEALHEQGVNVFKELNEKFFGSVYKQEFLLFVNCIFSIYNSTTLRNEIAEKEAEIAQLKQEISTRPITHAFDSRKKAPDYIFNVHLNKGDERPATAKPQPRLQ